MFKCESCSSKIIAMHSVKVCCEIFCDKMWCDVAKVCCEIFCDEVVAKVLWRSCDKMLRNILW